MSVCALCNVRACKNVGKEFPSACPSLDESFKSEVDAVYASDEEAKRIMLAAASVESEFYMQKTRIEETMYIARRMGAKKIGIAFCEALWNEGNVVYRVAKNAGFDVVSVICKVQRTEKTDRGIPKEYYTHGGERVEISCNPIAQAMYLNKNKCDLAISIGLCVGHDMLFNKYIEIPTTTLVVKDRVLCNNPAGALNQAERFYKSKLFDQKFE